jgi:hypothetical protein
VGFSVESSDTANPDILRFPGTPDCHLGAGCRLRPAIGVFLFWLLSGDGPVRAWGLACFFPGDDLDGRGAFRVQGPGGRLEGQGDVVVA